LGVRPESGEYAVVCAEAVQTHPVQTAIARCVLMRMSSPFWFATLSASRLGQKDGEQTVR